MYYAAAFSTPGSGLHAHVTGPLVYWANSRPLIQTATVYVTTTMYWSAGDSCSGWRRGHYRLNFNRTSGR